MIVRRRVPGHLVHIVPGRDLEASLVAAVEIGVRIVLYVEESIALLLYYHTGKAHCLGPGPYQVVALRCLSKRAVMVKPIACSLHPDEAWPPQ